MKTFGKLENELIDLCHQCPPDLEAIRSKIAEGADVNANDGDAQTKKSLLAEVIYNFGWVEENDSIEKYGCQYLCDVIQIILDAGFDITLDEGRYGAMALSHLIFCYTDEHVLDAAQLLLNAGANPSIAPYADEPHETVITMVSFDASVRLYDGDIEEFEILDSLTEMLKEATSKMSKS